MVLQDYSSARDAADTLGIEPLRLFRLARYMGVAPGDRCIPSDVISCAAAQAGQEGRYQVVLEWFLNRLKREEPSDNWPTRSLS